MISNGSRVRVLVGMHRGSVGTVEACDSTYVNVHLDHINKTRVFLIDGVIRLEDIAPFTSEDLKRLSLCVASYRTDTDAMYYPELYDKIQGLLK